MIGVRKRKYHAENLEGYLGTRSKLGVRERHYRLGPADGQDLPTRGKKGQIVQKARHRPPSDMWLRLCGPICAMCTWTLRPGTQDRPLGMMNKKKCRPGLMHLQQGATCGDVQSSVGRSPGDVFRGAVCRKK